MKNHSFSSTQFQKTEIGKYKLMLCRLTQIKNYKEMSSDPHLCNTGFSINMLFEGPSIHLFWCSSKIPFPVNLRDWCTIGMPWFSVWGKTFERAAFAIFLDLKISSISF